MGKDTKKSIWSAFSSRFAKDSDRPQDTQPEPPSDQAQEANAALARAGAGQLPLRNDQARLAALYRVSRLLGSSLDLDEVLNQVMDAVVGLTGAERGVLVFTEKDPKNWTLRVARNFDHRLDNWEAGISRTMLQSAIDHRKGMVTADAMSDPRFSTQASVLFNELRSMMCTPLLARGRVIGAIYIDSRVQKGVFDQEDLEMLDTFAVQAAYAIDNARMYTQTVQQVRQLKIELDEARKASQVAAITETEYFQNLRARADEMRKSGRQG